MSDLPPKPVNETFLLHTDPSRHVQKVVGVEVQKLPDFQEDHGEPTFCEVEGNTVKMLFTNQKRTSEEETLIVHGEEIPSYWDGERWYEANWTEQRTLELPSMALTEKSIVWAKDSVYSMFKKGNTTVSQYGAFCFTFEHVDRTSIRIAWGENQEKLRKRMDGIKANSNCLVLYHNSWHIEEEKHRFYILKWSDLEKGNYSEIGVQTPLPKEAWLESQRVNDFLLNKHNQLCAMWSNGLLILGGRFVGILEKVKERQQWTSIYELKSRKNRYVVQGHDGEYHHHVEIFRLIGSRGQIISSLEITFEKDRDLKSYQLGSSSFLTISTNYLSLVTATRDKLTLVADKILVWELGHEYQALKFCAIRNGGKRLGFVTDLKKRIASISLKYN